jgi:phosphonatase-like hydrolase
MTRLLTVFDVAGTTIKDDDAVARALSEAVAERGIVPSRDQIVAVMGLPKPIAIRALLADLLQGSDLDSNVTLAHESFERRMVEHYLSDPEVGPIDGAVEAFARLRRNGCAVALDTGFSRRIMSAILERLGWREGETIDITVTSDEVERGRPFPDMIHRAMARAGVMEPVCVTKVGDTVADMREGAAARCGLIIGVTTGTCSEAALRAENPTHVVESVRDVPTRVLGPYHWPPAPTPQYLGGTLPQSQ